ncbi:hypothetical protein Tco_0728541 [Tanacetum coccineum]|uniref:Pentatricopeptide repeat-containing protein n=1 Tax=Tanacetum coccineum TaxID=301880 RepID=A0ABQ4YLW2_9ASTR
MVHFFVTCTGVSALLLLPVLVKKTYVFENALMSGYYGPYRNAVIENVTEKGHIVAEIGDEKLGEVKRKSARDGLFLFLEMLGGDCGVKVSDRTLVCVLSAVSRVGCLETGVGVHGYIVKTMCDVEDDVYLGIGLVDIVHNDIVMGERVAKILISINPEMNLETYDNTEDYVALSNECASAGRWEDVAAVREVMNDKGMENKVAVASEIKSEAKNQNEFINQL